ncbi:hypothetical protein Ccr2_gp343 [Caulobacter phage Ccr2]|nr:hypothetical protein Ccr2_gp343 [Caulobacter phage Ccr2]
MRPRMFAFLRRLSLAAAHGALWAILLAMLALGGPRRAP